MGQIHDRIKKKQIMNHIALSMIQGGMVDASTKLSLANDGLSEKALVALGLSKKEVLHSIKVKGHYNGLCNVTACQSPNNVHYYNHIMHAFYCPHCTADINRCNARHKDVDEGRPFINFKTPEEAAKLYVK